MYNLSEQHNSLICDSFSEAYLDVTKHLVKNGKLEKSRNGGVIELLNFKTTITNPINRCVMGNDRNINIFFLLFEALWIWSGRKDVESLMMFNSNMKNYSDNGVTFHAPYGFRLRNYGVIPDNEYFNQNNREQSRVIEVNNGIYNFDQIEEIIKMLNEDSQDRRAVASIWNPYLDLNYKCKDIPCNDMLMFKIRDNKLHLTIQNRSNDLHWGLPTNVFQFSFMLELMALILGVEVGTQTHNSQSLHAYVDNPITLTMLNKNRYNVFSDLSSKIDFGFEENWGVLRRLRQVDDVVNVVIEDVLSYSKDSKLSYASTGSKTFDYIRRLLWLYLDYQSTLKSDNDKIHMISVLEDVKDYIHFDYSRLAKSFFAHRYKGNDEKILKMRF